MNQSASRLIVGVVAAAMAAGCEVRSAPRVAGETPPSWYHRTLPVMHFKKDAARERGWVLTTEGVVALDLRTRQTVAYVTLPGWIWVGAGYACPPDLVVGPRGEVLVSSNVVPTLWRVDPVSFDVTRHELTLDADRDRDVGFSALTYSAKQGAYFGSDGLSSWRIDPSLVEARKLEPSAAPSCSG